MGIIFKVVNIFKNLKMKSWAVSHLRAASLACKCDTAQHPIFEILKMLTPLRIINLMQ
jgi:hypothetical protein